MAGGKPGRPAKYKQEFKDNALEMAAGRGHVAGNAVSRSDRGPQYTSGLLADWAAANDVGLSVGRTGSRHDNAVAEGFFGTLKNGMRHLRGFVTRAEARAAVVERIEAYRNRRRPRSTIDCRIPAEVMAESMARMEEGAAAEREAAPLAA